MTFPDALVTLGVGVLGAGSALLATRLGAAGAEKQWRRDQVLRFAADVIAAANAVRIEVAQAHQSYMEIDVAGPWPGAALERLSHAVALAILVSPDLGDVANELHDATRELARVRGAEHDEYLAARNAFQGAISTFLATATKQLS